VKIERKKTFCEVSVPGNGL